MSAPTGSGQQAYRCARGQHADEIATEYDYGKPWGVRMVWKCPHCGNVRGRA